QRFALRRGLAAESASHRPRRRFARCRRVRAHAARALTDEVGASPLSPHGERVGVRGEPQSAVAIVLRAINEWRITRLALTPDPSPNSGRGEHKYHCK